MSNRELVMNFVSKLPEHTPLDEIARKVEVMAAVKAVDEPISSRQRILNLISKMPENTPMEEILEKVEFVAGIEQGLAQADRREGKTAEEVRELVKKWAYQ